MNDSLRPAAGPGRQLARYGLVGLVSNLAGYLVYLLITYCGGEPKATMSFVYLVGAIVGFFGNRHWTFGHEGVMWRSVARYVTAHGIGYLLNLAILLVLVDRLGYAHEWVQAFAVIAVAGLLFILFKLYVFPARSRAAGPP